MLVRGLAMLLVAALAGLGVQSWRLHSLQTQAAQTREHQATLREDAMHSALVETARRLTAQQKVAQYAQTTARQARVDAAAADTAAGQLRQYAADLAASADACHSAAATVGTPGGAAGSVLAELLGRVEARGRELAAEADRRGTAGTECEQRYDALSSAPP